MFRPLLAGVFVAGLLAATGSPDSIAQDKKDAPKKPARIAIAEPTEAVKDPDFAIQGEYEGEVKTGDQTVKVGIQLVAKGDGKFFGKAYYGGLPGAGWDGKMSKVGTAERTGDKKATLKDDKGNVVGELVDGTITIKGEAIGTVKKVDRTSKTIGAKPLADAVVLFGGEGDEKNWNGGKLVTLSDGKYLDVGVTSKQKFGAFKAHVEFRLPWMPNSTGQGRGNSGVYFQNRYECQVLDSFGLSGENNECGGIYTQHKPSVNMCLPPLAWQTYDIEFTPAQFDANGKKTKNARATVYHNGVKIHDNIEFPKECPGGQKEDANPGSFQFQNHGDPVVYRNVWVVEVK
ncbi:Uncharacterized protein OS=Pirellula staleyi (strain ATCC 27377 / DSM 6068 / ICPB 4128) GN=Psta_3759 PE=4 SV=1: DUF1080 [Gemmata massiliana]|uniref:3-keto-alpha-glucoside-1,2-lyase/3-keto-2-hydroxy-glucal hydratase domain-containing protein n=1 Tax=Gemmata massiliana TaxID=1210884 RepID=A0A6P2CXF6_9BACT|nr:DUF1080 domain-containing protein [Gemmata massiliana]VTR91792.1 Uncharacterized protein OS=Pirellula staleyi (strain ATCC 27377 / DSM 6068 / ICPB 4128) GN=Psta_3759 PE=4 SV=1: DUF1080 [Gemmata massiliana]